MQNVKVQFKGIVRNTDEGISSDGECMELINAHVNNGSIEPIGKPILKAALGREYDSIHYHTSAKRYIGIAKDGTMYEISEDLTTETPMSTDVVAKSIAFVGNTIAVSTSDKGMVYFLFKQNEYSYLGGIPDLPDAKIDKTLFVVTTAGALSSYGTYMEILSKANKDGYFSHSAAFRIAYRLYDGSYIKQSHIRLIYLTEHDTYSYQGTEFKGSHSLFNGNIQADGEFKLISKDKDKVGLLCFYPNIKLKNIPENLQAWEDIILSIDVFCTENFRHPYNSIIEGVGPSEDYPTPYDKAKEMSLFYLYKSYKINNLEGSIIGQDISHDMLSTREKLNDDVFSHNILSFDRLHTYNNRVHAFGRNEKAMSWYKDNNILTDNTKELPEPCEMYVTIKGQNKDIILKKEIMCPPKFGPYLMYPDSRATFISIINRKRGKHKKFKLEVHPTLNLSFYCKEKMIYLYPSNIWVHGNAFELEDMEQWEGEIPEYKETPNIVSEDNNILRVSEINSPFSFPADQTYQFNTTITGVQSNVIAMSQGQFGQFPLYVFTKDGIYALAVGQGKVAYVTQTPVTRDVCNNPDSICPLDTSVAFSTDKGLMAISGTQVQPISEQMYGFLPSCIISSPIIGKIMNVANMADMASSVAFPEYLETANVGFNYQGQEIIVSNKDFPYSYVYSLKTGLWHKVSHNITGFVNAYPSTWVMKGNEIYDFNNNDRTVSTIALISRPIKMGTLTHKRILQTALRGIVKRSLGSLYLKGQPLLLRGEELTLFHNVGMYILGSNDAEHFTLIAKKENMIDIRDLVTKMNKSKPYKYFMVCLVGGVRTDVSINYIEMNVDESFTNRLR